MKITGFIARHDGYWLIKGNATPAFKRGAFHSMADWKGRIILVLIKLIFKVLKVKEGI